MSSFDSADEAAAHFAQAFQETVSCVTDARFNFPQVHPLDQTRALILGGGDDVRLDDEFYLYAAHHYQVVGQDEGFVVRTGGYLYTVNSDSAGGEVLSWHWHPERDHWCVWPHLHADHDHGDHVPTGRVAFEQIIRWLIEEHELESSRPDWSEVLDRNEQDWRSRRSWA